MYIDTHCHLDGIARPRRDEIVDSVDGYIIISGYDNYSNKEVIDLINEYPKAYGTLGIHPDEVIVNNLDELENLLKDSKVVGIGEIGLDYHYGKNNVEKQKEYFIKQIEIARKYNLPIVVHSRDAAQDTYNILKEYASDMKIVMHCFSYSLEMAKKFLEFDIKFGIGGVVTFKNSKNLVEVVKEIPLEYFVLETDSPWLTPEPFRGKLNEPKNIPIIAKKIAEIKEISVEEVLKQTTMNAILQFDLPI